MINPALDYLSRHPDILDLKIPCSFMANGIGGVKRVVAVHAVPTTPSTIHVKTWRLDELQEGEIMPASTGADFPKEMLRTPWMFFPQGVRPLGYMAEFPAVSSNRKDRPIPQETYDAICGNMCFSMSHHENRQQFLWEAFEHHFLKDHKWQRGFPRTHIRNHLREWEPRKQQYWEMWKVHMLDGAGQVAPELFYWATSVAFSSSCDGLRDGGSSR